MKITELEVKYQCDECKLVFVGKDIKLEPYASNIKIFGRHIYVVDKNGVIVKTLNPFESDRTVHCPKCNTVHLFGFNKAEEVLV